MNREGDAAAAATETASRLLQVYTTAAAGATAASASFASSDHRNYCAGEIETYDESHGLYGELYSADRVLESLVEVVEEGSSGVNKREGSKNVGVPRIDEGRNNKRRVQLKSFNVESAPYLNSRFEQVNGGGTSASIPLVVQNQIVASNEDDDDDDDAARNCLYLVRVRWIDERGLLRESSTHRWDVPPPSTTRNVQRRLTHPGHLFLFSLVAVTPGGGNAKTTTTAGPASLFDDDDDDVQGERLLGGYRVLRARPSGAPHLLTVQNSLSRDLILFENLLQRDHYHGAASSIEDGNDDDKFDALVVAAWDLDHRISAPAAPVSMAMGSSPTTTSSSVIVMKESIKMLQTILRNVAILHPDDPKYHKLRLSNSKVRKYVTECCWGSLEFVRVIGFVERTSSRAVVDTDNGTDNGDGSETVKQSTGTAATATEVIHEGKSGNPEDDDERYLVLLTPTSKETKALCRQGLKLLDILADRSSPRFVAELAPPTPWQSAPMAATNRSGNRPWPSPNRGFITAEERWHRAERWAQLRRSGAARRPEPGNAPSSRGNWGR